MARCCGDACACKLVQGSGINITGTGTSADPFIISGGGTAFTVSDTTAIDLTLVSGVLSAVFNTTSKLDMLGDVVATAPTNGQVLAFDTSSGHWIAANPTTASSGSVLHDTSLTGDGSAGAHLAVQHAPSGFTETASGGVKITDNGINQLVRNFTNAAARTAASPVPDLNTLSMLDSAPGEIDYWTGSAWMPFATAASLSATSINGGNGTELVNLSGSYSGQNVRVLVKNISDTGDAGGVVTLLSSADLAGLAGVLSVSVQTITGSGLVPSQCAVSNTTGQVKATFYRISNGTVMSLSPVKCVVTAYVY